MLEDDWSESGQKERVTVRLKELIRNYPCGIGIMKESIQNADDAGASLSALFDLRVHPAGRVPDPRMNTVMGLALLIASESVFSQQRDFEIIQHMGEGNKTGSGPKTGAATEICTCDRSDAHPGVSIEVHS